jgi:uncharacterized protein DUF1439
MIAVIALLAVGAAAAYLAIHGKEYVYRIPEQVLRERLSARLPITKTYLILFQVTLDHPRIALEDGSDRVDAGIDVAFNLRVDNAIKRLVGSLDFSGGIRYSQETGEFFLTEPIIQRVKIESLPDRYIDLSKKLLAHALQDFIASHSVYSLSTTDATELGIRLALKRVIVKDHELVVTLGV